ncbi:hypothetical protein BGX38DRAFT_1268064 [Terfezia claveryi]|nr:hypothetical protein BGX38DRAFT_1268064 [Terfezia claveryi]
MKDFVPGEALPSVQKICNVFEEALLEGDGVVHILIRGPAEAELDAAEIRFTNLHRKYWRKGDEGWKEIRKSGKIDIPPLDDPDTPPPNDTDALEYKTYSYTYIDLGSDFNGFFGGWIQFLCEMNTIQWKPLFLYYILISRIIKGKTTAFKYRIDDIYLFGEHFQRSKKIDGIAHPGAWALSDSNASSIQPSHGFTLAGLRFLQCQRRPHNPIGGKNGRIIVMLKWTPWIGGHGRKYIPVHKDFKPAASSLTTMSSCVFLRITPVLLAGVTNLRVNTELEYFINLFITNPPPFSLIESTLLVQANIGDNTTINHPSDIIAIKPNQDHKPILVIATRHIEYCNQFWTINATHTAAGWMWENYVIGL